MTRRRTETEVIVEVVVTRQIIQQKVLKMPVYPDDETPEEAGNRAMRQAVQSRSRWSVSEEACWAEIYHPDFESGPIEREPDLA